MDDSIDPAQLQPSAHRARIQDEEQVRRWYAEGRTYTWMSDEYERRYNITTTPTFWSYHRRRRGWSRRIVRDDALIPWPITPQHRWHFYFAVLRMEARRRAGASLAKADVSRLEVVKHELAERDLVVAYDPQTEEGFSLVPRRPGIDHDLIREPDDRQRRTIRPPG